MTTPPRNVDRLGTTLLTSATTGPVLVLVAVEFEAHRLARALRLTGRPEKSSSLVLRRIGVRASELRRLAPELTALRPGGVLIVGLAGGCAADLAPGELVVASATASAAGRGLEWLVPDPRLTERALGALAATDLTYRVAPLLTVPDPLLTPAAKADCWHRCGAVAVDMESAVAVRWAREAGIPALAVRAVADGPGDPLPRELLEALDATGRLRPGAVVGWIRHPAVVESAWRLWRRSRLALDHLARFLAAFMGVGP